MNKMIVYVMWNHSPEFIILVIDWPDKSTYKTTFHQSIYILHVSVLTGWEKMKLIKTPQTV